MNKEELKDYLKRVDELELKLTGEDKDTYQWLLFGYNECARLLNEKEQENKELHNKIDKAIEYINWWVDDNKKLEIGLTISETDGLLKILKGDVDE